MSDSRPPILALAFALCVQIAGAFAVEADSATLRIHGSNTVGEHLAPALISEWLKSRKLNVPEAQTVAINEREWTLGGLKVQLHAHGSNTGMRDLMSGRTDVAMSSRAVFADEVKAAEASGLGRLDAPGQEFVIALDGLAIIVHPNNPVSALDVDTVRRIFAGEISRWGQVGGRESPIRLYARDDKSGTYETFRMLVLGGSALHGGSRRFESTGELAAAVAADPAAIGFVGLGGVGTAKALAIRDAETEPLLPQVGAVAVEDYLLTRRLYLYLRNDASALARSFATFATSDAAQTAVERTGFVDQAIRAVAMEPGPNAPEEYRTLVEDARRLSLNFRFGSGSSLLDSRAARDVDRLTAFLKRPGQVSGRIVLLGFADASETLPYLAISLANDRVDYVANLLTARGIPVAAARGLGGTLPLASNRTDWGRYKNRRVEVWLEPDQASAQ